MSTRFGKERVKRGMINFLTGKVVSALAGLMAMIFVVQGLSVSEFASYSILVALVEFFTAVTGVGLAHVVLRYVPELYATHRALSLRSVVLATMGLRTGVLLTALVIAYFLSIPLAHLINLDGALQAFEIFLIVVGFRSTAHFLSQILESTLHQGISQLAFSASAVGRCLGMFWLLRDGSVSLLEVISLEALCDAFACSMLAIGISKTLMEVARDKNPHTEDQAWWLNHRQAVAKFAVHAYLQHLATLPFGGNINRLVGGSMFGDRVMASFGFALLLYEYFKRYLPTQLLIGLIRPIVVARFSISKNFNAAVNLCDQALQINLIFLLGAIAVLFVAGSDLLTLLSAGKYGNQSVWILIALLLLLGLETQRLVLELLTQTVEQYGLMIPCNLFLSLSIFLGMAGYSQIGAISFPIANALALILTNSWINRKMSKLGYRYCHAWRSTGIIFSMFIGAITVGY
jgi:hypothetical protein